MGTFFVYPQSMLKAKIKKKKNLKNYFFFFISKILYILYGNAYKRGGVFMGHRQTV